MSSLVRIRDVETNDLDVLFRMQGDSDSRWMAAFGTKDFNDKEAFLIRMSKIAADANSIFRVLEHAEEVIGFIGKWVDGDRPELMYWVDRKFWGKGIASSAVEEFLLQYSQRPLYAHIVSDNLASQAILIKNGFTKYEEVTAFSDIRNVDVVEIGFVLN